jgi:hypothetical protein
MTKHADRRLTPEERATLEFLLIDEIPRVDQLRTQAESAQVSGRCDCGCPTIDLAIDEYAPIWTPGVSVDRIVAMAFSRGMERPAELLLHALDGRLIELEYVDMAGNQPQASFPPLSTWQEPLVGPGPASYRWPKGP